MSDEPQLFGYTPNVEATEGYCDTLAFPRIADTPLMATLAEPRDVNLWLPLLELKPDWKRGAQKIGDCVSWGAELACTMLLAIQAKLGTSEWIAEAATEPIYGGGRVEAQGGKLGGYSDGSWGSAAAQWLRDWGILLRLDYSQETRIADHDLTKYSGSKAKEWGNFGAGGKYDAGREDGKLDTIAKRYPVKEVSRVLTTEELAAALQNGYPVTVASGVGYGSMKRNADGVVRASGSWAHQMMFGGVRWVGGKPQFRQFQSWGPNSCSGPDPGIDHEAVSGCSWWTTEADAQRQLNARDSFAFGHAEGFPPQKLDWSEIAATWNWGSRAYA